MIMKTMRNLVLSVLSLTIAATIATATSPVSYELTCSEGMYWVGINSQHGGRISVDLGFGRQDSAVLYPAGYNSFGNPVYRGSAGASYQVLLNNSSMPSISIYQDNVFPTRWLANIYCRRGF
jgi:hypothetical protein